MRSLLIKKNEIYKTKQIRKCENITHTFLNWLFLAYVHQVNINVFAQAHKHAKSMTILDMTIIYNII